MVGLLLAPAVDGRAALLQAGRRGCHPGRRPVRSAPPSCGRRDDDVLAGPARQVLAGNHVDVMPGVSQDAGRRGGRFSSSLNCTATGDRQRKREKMLTTCYSESMSVNVSVRLDDMLAERLRLRARAAGESLSDRLRRYAEEGSRRDEHTLITFRDGPAGRRAAVVGGPDVWEIVMWLEDLASEGDPVRVLAAEQDVSRPLIDAALRYRDAYPDEVEARIALHRHDTAAADAR